MSILIQLIRIMILRWQSDKDFSKHIFVVFNSSQKE